MRSLEEVRERLEEQKKEPIRCYICGRTAKQLEAFFEGWMKNKFGENWRDLPNDQWRKVSERLPLAIEILGAGLDCLDEDETAPFEEHPTEGIYICDVCYVTVTELTKRDLLENDEFLDKILNSVLEEIKSRLEGIFT